MSSEYFVEISWEKRVSFSTNFALEVFVYIDFKISVDLIELIILFILASW